MRAKSAARGRHGRRSTIHHICCRSHPLRARRDRPARCQTNGPSLRVKFLLDHDVPDDLSRSLADLWGRGFGPRRSQSGDRLQCSQPRHLREPADRFLMPAHRLGRHLLQTFYLLVQKFKPILGVRQLRGVPHLTRSRPLRRIRRRPATALPKATSTCGNCSFSRPIRRSKLHLRAANSHGGASKTAVSHITYLLHFRRPRPHRCPRFPNFIRPDFSAFLKPVHATRKNGATIGSRENRSPSASTGRPRRRTLASFPQVLSAIWLPKNTNFAKRTGFRPNLFDFTSLPSHTRSAQPPAAPTRLTILLIQFLSGCYPWPFFNHSFSKIFTARNQSLTGHMRSSPDFRV